MEPTELIQQQTQALSKKVFTLFLLWILLIDIFFYSESFGLNAILVTIISIPLFLWIYPKNAVKVNWWFAAGIWLLTSIGVFVNGNYTSIYAFIFAFFYFVTINRNDKLSLVNSTIQSVPIIILGIISIFFHSNNFFRKSENKKNKWVINFLMVTLPLTVIIIFLKLYQAADQDFYELTKFINLDFISWGFLFLYVLLSVLLFGYFSRQKFEDIDDFEEKLPNDIFAGYKDKLQEFFGPVNEARIAAIILISLNLMLILYNALDIKFIMVDMHDPTSEATLSEIVHAGIYALITSIVLVILIVTHILRGQLNFLNNKLIKPLIVFWLLQNVLMIASTFVKNYEYIHFWGLTYKRIGVIVYLLLALIGICLTLYKVIKKKTFWFLMRKTSVAFAIGLAALLTFNWNRAIAAYNTSYIPTERIDFDYLYELGPDTYPYILDHHIKHASVENDLLIKIENSIHNVIFDMKLREKKTTWKSYVWSDIQLTEDLKKYNIIIQ